MRMELSAWGREATKHNKPLTKDPQSSSVHFLALQHLGCILIHASECNTHAKLFAYTHLI